MRVFRALSLDQDTCAQVDLGEDCLLWGVELRSDPAALRRCLATLNADERARADRFARREDRSAFVLCRAALRFLLADRLGCRAEDLHFSTGTGGKPRLLGKQVAFSVAHTLNFGLICIGSDVRIGVDIENGDRFVDSDIAEFVLTPAELVYWQTLAEPRATFELARQWVAKEALLKALGVGLSVPMSDFWLTLAGFRTGSRISIPDAQTVAVWHVENLFCSLVVLDRQLSWKPAGTLRARAIAEDPIFQTYNGFIEAF